jgi:hypothetical protein
MRLSVFIILVLGLVIAGCTTQQPVITTIEKEILKTDTIILAFPDEITLNELATCDSLGQVKQRTNKELTQLVDSLKNLPAQFKIIHHTTFKESKKDTLIIYKDKVIIQKESFAFTVSQIKWLILSLGLLILIVIIYREFIK